MAVELTKYSALRDQGGTADEVYRQMRRDGVQAIAAIGPLRRLFDLSLIQAKEVLVRVDEHAASLNDYQGQLLPVLQAALT